MDKYDILFIWNTFITWMKEFHLDRKDLITRYTVAKLDWMRRNYYLLRVRRSAKYRRKHGDLPIRGGIEEITTLDRRGRYAWQMFKPMEKK